MQCMQRPGRCVPELPEVRVQLLLDLLQELRDGVPFADRDHPPMALPVPVAVCDLQRLIPYKLRAHKFKFKFEPLHPVIL